MKISFEKKILLGFIINLIVVIVLGLIFIYRFKNPRNESTDSLLNWSGLSLIVLSLLLLTIVYFIIRAQLKAKNISQNALLENEKLLQSIIDNTSNPIFIKKINGEYLLINKQFESLFQISNTDIIGKTDSDFLPKDIADNYRNSDFEVIKALKELKTEEIIQQPDGIHTYLAVKFPLYDSAGRIYAIGGISTDISERKKLEESSKAADTFFNMSFDVFIIIENDVFVKVNPSFERILGYTQNEVLGKTLLEYMHPADIAVFNSLINKLKSNDSVVNLRFRFRCKDDSYKWLDWTSTIDLQTGILFAAANDVSELLENEESLKISNMFFNMAFNIFTVAKDEHFIKINQAFTKTLGYTQADMNQIKYMDLIHPDDKPVTIEILEKHTKGQSIVNFRNRFICKDGTYKWLDWSSNVDMPLGVFYSVARDITEFVQLEDQQQTAINELYENEEKLRLVVENIGEGVLVANADKKIILANTIANEIFGIADDEKISSSFENHFKLYFPDGKTTFPSQNLPMQRALNGESTNDVDLVIWNPILKEKRRVLISGRPLVDQNDKVVAAVVTIKDISKYKQLEEELHETELKYRQLIGFKKGNDTVV